MSDVTGKVTGRGGPGRGQGLKPLYDEAMSKKPVELAPEMVAFLGEGEQAAGEKLRRLLEWGRRNEANLLKYTHKRGADLVRTSFAMTDEHWEVARYLGDGVRVKGIRRVIHTAMEGEAWEGA